MLLAHAGHDVLVVLARLICPAFQRLLFSEEKRSGFETPCDAVERIGLQGLNRGLNLSINSQRDNRHLLARKIKRKKAGQKVVNRYYQCLFHESRTPYSRFDRILRLSIPDISIP